MRNKRSWIWSKQQGSVADLAGTCLCILGMSIIMLAYMENVALIQQKAMICQIARKYILRMETVGYLTAEDETSLCRQLQDVGASKIDLEGSTRNQVDYGNAITLRITGYLGEEQAFEETRVSTAKY